MNCHACPICNGYGCIGELPGMGGFANNINFQNNVEGWNKVAYEKGFTQNNLDDYAKGILDLPNLKDYPVRLGPMTGGVENVGYSDERQFYFDLIAFARNRGIALSIGDGCPDCKLQYGIGAVKKYDTAALAELNAVSCRYKAMLDVGKTESLEQAAVFARELQPGPVFCDSGEKCLPL